MSKLGSVAMGLCACLLAAPHLATAATCTWTGGGTNNNWSTAANWDACGGAHAIPQTNDTLIFPAGAARGTPVNDFAALHVGVLQITGVPASGSSYVISGNGITLTLASIQFNAPLDGSNNGPSLNVPIVLGIASVISNIGTGAARLGGAITMGAF